MLPRPGRTASGRVGSRPGKGGTPRPSGPPRAPCDTGRWPPRRCRWRCRARPVAAGYPGRPHRDVRRPSASATASSTRPTLRCDLARRPAQKRAGRIVSGGGLVVIVGRSGFAVVQVHPRPQGSGTWPEPPAVRLPAASLQRDRKTTREPSRRGCNPRETVRKRFPSEDASWYFPETGDAKT